MQGLLRIVLVDPREDTRQPLKRLLLGMDSVWLEAECSRYEFFEEVVAQSNPHIAIISLDADPDLALELVSTVRRTFPRCNVLVVSSQRDGEWILAAVRRGAKEYITSPVQPQEFIEALNRLRAETEDGANSSFRSSTITAVAGASGGVGTTALAINLGCSLAQEPGSSVVIVDLDLVLGDTDVCLDLVPDHTLIDVCENIDRLDFTLLKRSLTQHSSGVFLLPRPAAIEDASRITPQAISRMLGLLRATFNHVIVDLSKSYLPTDWAALELADQILMVGLIDLSCLRNMVRLLQAFKQHDGMMKQTRVVLNRIGYQENEISLKKAQQTIGQEIFWQVPNDWQAVCSAHNHGEPLFTHAPKSKVNRSIVSLGRAISHAKPEPAADGSARRSLLASLWSW